MEEPLRYFLNHIEEQYEIEIIFACECGSRAYGLESEISDFDVFFVFINNDAGFYDDYLNNRRNRFRKNFMSMRRISRETIRELKDKYNYKGESLEIDWHGWDITKAMKHLYEMNPSIIEFVFSPIIYRNKEPYRFMENSRNFINDQDRIAPILTHYRLLGRKFYNTQISNEQSVDIKAYFATLRCCLMLKWLIEIRLNRYYCIDCFNKYYRNKYIQLNLVDVVNDLQTDLSDLELDAIHNMFAMKRNMQYNEEQTSRDQILDEFMLETVNNNIDLIKQVSKDEKNSSQFGNVNEYNSYLYFCLNKCFN